MDSAPSGLRLHRSLSGVEYFAFGFGSMVGVGWLVLMDDWLGRGGPLGAMLGFLAAGVLLLPVAQTYGRLVARIQDAGAEIAYTEGVFPPGVSFAAGWTMVLAYAIVCPWEAVAIGNLLARVFPQPNAGPVYEVAGKTIFAPRVVLGLLLTALVTFINLRGIRPSGIFQDITTFGLLAIFAVFASLGFARGSPANMQPLFARPGADGAWLSVLLMLQVVPYFMTGFESVAKGSEEARPGFDPRGFSRAMVASVTVGAFFYVTVIGAVSYVFPWRDLTSSHLGTEAAFERAFGSRIIADLIVFAAFLSLLKVFNGNFVAATRLLFAIGRRGLVHPSLARLHAGHGTPVGAILLVSAVTLAASLLGDAALVPITEVGSLAAGVGWLSASLAYLSRRRAAGEHGVPAAAWLAVVVSLAIILMKVLPGVPGSFSRAEWTAFALWSLLGLAFWLGRRRPAPLTGRAGGRLPT
jgi:basic amino acid/polyamine antiporter, APA family